MRLISSSIFDMLLGTQTASLRLLENELTLLQYSSSRKWNRFATFLPNQDTIHVSVLLSQIDLAFVLLSTLNRHELSAVCQDKSTPCRD